MTFVQCGLFILLAGMGVAQASDQRNARVDEVMPEFERVAGEYAKAWATPGLAVAVVTPDRVQSFAYGVKEAGQTAEIRTDTIFQLASVSKPITATFVAALVSQGKLSWETPVQSLLPWFAFADADVSRRLTIKDMLSQRSGLPGETGDFLETLGYDEGYILRQMRFVNTTPNFRQKWAYANFGITTGGVAATQVTGRDFAKAVREELFQPVGMKTAFVSYQRLKRLRNRAHLHFTIDGQSEPRFIRDAQPEAPGGGINGSVEDLAELVQLYLNEGKVDGRELIRGEVLRQTYEPISELGNGGYYGLCWNVRSNARGPQQVNHSGAFLAGARTEITFWPQDGVGIVVLTNNFPNLLPEALSDVFYQLYRKGKVEPGTLAKYQRLTKQVFNVNEDVERLRESRDLVDPLGDVPLSAYAGAYENDYVGRVEIRLGREMLGGKPKLALKAGPRFGPIPIKRLGESTTLISTTKEGDPVEYRFKDLRDGVFQELHFPALEPIGWEKLKRVR